MLDIIEKSWRGDDSAGATPARPIRAVRKLGRQTAADILAKELPPVSYVVPGYLSEGLTILAVGDHLGRCERAHIECALRAYSLDWSNDGHQPEKNGTPFSKSIFICCPYHAMPRMDSGNRVQADRAVCSKRCVSQTNSTVF